jgi:hypothetical protein
MLKMKNFRRLALVAGVAALSAVAFSPKAQAQTANVDFSGTVPATCTVISANPGTLAMVSDSQYTAYNYPGDSIGVGVAGNIKINCNAGTTFTVTSVSDNGGTVNFSNADGTNVATDKGVTIRDATTKAIVSSTTLGAAGPVITGPLTSKNYAVQLNLFTLSSQPLPVGNYKVRAVVTLAPQ